MLIYTMLERKSGIYIKNMKIPEKDWVTPKAEIRNTPGKGKGLFAIQPIVKGEEVIIWGGEYVGKEKVEEMQKQGKLIIRFDEDLYSVENEGESDAYFINHSCGPNLWMRDTFTLEAMRDINISEELTADYVLWEERGDDYVSKWECRCSSPDCRKRITGKDWRLKNLQEKYKGHFSPLINKKIEKQDNEKQ